MFKKNKHEEKEMSQELNEKKHNEEEQTTPSSPENENENTGGNEPHKKEKHESEKGEKCSHHKKGKSCHCHEHTHHHHHQLNSPAEQIALYKEKNLRLLAEMENARKRMQKEKSEMLGFVAENTILEFLPVLDNFENALRFSKQASEEVQKWAVGFDMILNQFREVLHNHGIVAFHSEGNLFDPHEHEAMEIVETTDVPDGTILEEFAKGYKCKSRTLRPAHVKVARAPKEISSEEKKSDEEDNQEEK